MKIGFVLDDSLDRPDGVQQAVLTLGEWLRGQGHTVNYLVVNTTRRDIAGVRNLGRTLPVTFNGNKMGTALPVSKAMLRRYLAAERFDILHVQMPYSPFFGGRVIKAAPPATAVVGTYHILPINFWARFGSRLLGICQQSSLRRLALIAAVSKAAQEFAASNLRLPVAVIANPIEVERFKRPQPEPGHRLRVVFLGRLVERKGIIELCKAWELCLTQHPELAARCELVIGGKGDLSETVVRWRARLPADWHIEQLGFVQESAKADLLNSADVAVFPSLGGESFGIILLEAMAAGARVVLGGDNPGYRSVLGDHPRQIVDAAKISQFASRLYEFLTNAGARHEAHDWQIKTVINYDINVVGRQWLTIYEQLHAKWSQA